jgi:iron complex outermembrane receptor protein
VRVTQERHEIETGVGFAGEETYTLVTPKLAVAYHLDSDRQIYVSATRGARSGGFNRLSSSALGEEYDPESLWSYEAGLKSEWFARTLTFNAAVFYIDWTDQQIRTQVAPGSVLIDNAGRSFSEGFELEASWRPVQGLELSGFLGVTHGEYEKYVDRFGVDLAGNTLVNTPELTAGLIAQYRWPIANSPFVGLVRGEYLYTGDQYFDAENRLEQDGYGLVNLRAGIETDTFSAVVFAKNLFDQDYRVYGYRDFEGSMLASDIAVAGESRLVGVTATWRY